MTPDDLESKRWVFDHPYHVVLSLAVGGGFSRPPNAATAFPQEMLVDCARVYAPTSAAQA